MRLLRGTAVAGLTGLFLLGASHALQTAVAEGDTRTISFHHLHTGEDITITYKREGRYDDAALKKIDWFMRDWRKDESTHMDAHLIDLLWETNREVGGTEPIQVVCGYRSPETNTMLRARSSGVAQVSQHTHGQAMDFYLPGVPLEAVRIVGLRLQRGGVGFYPTSGSPFVHLDTGTVRHWPRMTHDQLARVFPDGRTVHIPSDGQPLANYALALADVESRGAQPSAMSLAAARDHGIDTDNVAAPKRSLFARIFGGSKSTDEDERGDEATANVATSVAAPTPKSTNLRTRAPTVVASLAPPTRVAVERITPLPTARPKTVAVAALEPVAPAPQKIVTASAGAEMPTLFDNRGYWRGAIDAPAEAPRTAGPFQTASLTPEAKAAFAYAPAEGGVQNSTTVAKPPLASAPAQITGSPADPWLRAAILTPSMSTAMTATQIGPVDPRPLATLLHKPTQALTMTFSADPYAGMMADRFDGRAVVFLATATFAPAGPVTLSSAATAMR